MTTARNARLLGLATGALVLQTASCFSTPVNMALRPAGAQLRPGVVDRRDATGAFLLALGGQVAALSLLQPRKTYESPAKWMVDAFQVTRPAGDEVEPGEDFSEQELFKYQRRMRKIADNMGEGEMEKIADALGFEVSCMSSDLCQKAPFAGDSGFD
jgi:hypothetical protein